VSRARSATAWAALGIAAGTMLGLIVWSGYQDRHARSLFSPRARRRFAALSRLASDADPEESVDTIALLREYVAWEPHPLLRRRGRALLVRLASTLD